MPIYGYICKNRHYFEYIKKVEEMKKEERCPECGEKAVRSYRDYNVGVFAHGCPSYTFKRIADNQRIFEKTNREIVEENEEIARKAGVHDVKIEPLH
ncbi:MAG: FmdB family zinc ribbon protein [Candidatus Aenigmatarchaeota archaeon]